MGLAPLPLQPACLGALAWLAGCESSPEELSPAEYVEQHSGLLGMIGSYEEEKRHEGIALLKRLGKRRGSEVCMYILSDPNLRDYRVEVVLAGILAEWEDGRAIPYLLEYLKHPDDGAVEIASEALRFFAENERVLEALGEMARSQARRERVAAVEVLSRMGNPRILELFLERYRGEMDDEIRGLMLTAAAGSRHPRARDLLIEALTDPDTEFRAMAWRGLKRQFPGLPSEVEFDADAPLDERAQAIAVLRMWAKAGARGRTGSRNR